MREEDVRIVRSRWYSFGSIRVNLGILVAFVIGMLFVFAKGEVYHDSILNSVFWALLGLTLTLGLLFGAMFLAITRRVEVSGKGVTFYMGLQKVSVPWTELIPPKYPYSLGSIIFERKVKETKYLQNLAASITQAQAILSHPSCPRFKLSNDIWMSLSMEPPKSD